MAVGKRKIECPLYAEGTAVSEEDIKTRKVTHYEDHPDIRYSWTAGQAISRFLNGLKEGKILGVKCDGCKRIMVPPRMFCELCYKPIDGWVELKDTGTILTYSISYIDPDARPLPKPIVVALIQIDGASQNMAIMHLIGEIEPEKVYVGMRVKAVWKPENEREGSVTDIKYWKPLEG
ncbi:MAG: Zn-ribbon domain-containing OB-fold protein [Archaeoglobaceae archaeon]|nr:Zn-ribbon domain-containing OB-fold protein [Archaeoglobaceae archaeon]MCX8151767.1 Zn-ribbon domain-containing OB-fold protein [Archaeoglobaceae archaeon]MDW8013208.1 Zn-ribbon domain-containing OB-fold protein [Archaeoglobaceae archaeon]